MDFKYRAKMIKFCEILTENYIHMFYPQDGGNSLMT